MHSENVGSWLHSVSSKQKVPGSCELNTEVSAELHVAVSSVMSTWVNVESLNPACG